MTVADVCIFWLLYIIQQKRVARDGGFIFTISLEKERNLVAAMRKMMTSWYLDEPKMEDCAAHVLLGPLNLYVTSNRKSQHKHRPAAISPKDCHTDLLRANAKLKKSASVTSRDHANDASHHTRLQTSSNIMLTAARVQ